MGHTAIGKDLAPRVAARFAIGLFPMLQIWLLKNEKLFLLGPFIQEKRFKRKNPLAQEYLRPFVLITFQFWKQIQTGIQK